MTVSRCDRDPDARAALVTLLLALLGLALTRRGHSVESVDVRTYLEMTKGVSVNGLPYLSNGPVDRFPALLVPWNVLHNGHYWGVYGPLYPYFAAPFLLAGGLRLMGVATYALTIPIAFATFAIGRRVLESERWAVLAAAVAVGSTPILAKSTELTAYPLAVLLSVLAVHVTLIALEARRPLGWSFLAGALFALSSEAHLLCVPVGAALLVILATCDATDEREVRAPSFLARTILRSFWPTRRSLLSAAVALAGEVVFLLPGIALNRARFGILNPFTYGPTPWRGADVAEQTIGAHLRFAGPVLAVVVLAVVLLVLSAAVANRGTRLGVRLLVLVGAAATILAQPMIHDRAWALGQAGFAYIFDQSVVPLEGYRRGPQGLGHLYGPWVTKATLQCSPIFFLVFALLFRARMPARKMQQLGTIALPCFALYVYLALRGNLGLASALGYPWVYTRYTMPALPMLALLAVFELRRLAVGRVACIVAIVGGLTELAWLEGSRNDEDLARQYVLLLQPLVAGGLACILSAASRRATALLPVATVVTMATLGIGFGQSLGHELHANIEGKGYCDWYSDLLRKNTPARFAVFGALGPIDPVLAVRAERDVEYADINQLSSITEIRGLLDHWLATGRPVFYVTVPQPVTSPWPDMEFRPVGDTQRIWKVVPRAAGPSGS